MSGLPELAEDNNKDEIVRLLQQGADVNEQTEYGRTALFVACLYNTELVQILLQNKKINVNLKSNYVSGPFYTACSNDNYECVLIMLQDARVDVNLAGNTYGWSPLMIACYWGNNKTVQLLISFGRNIDIHKKSTKDYLGIKSGSTALDVAKQKNETAVVQLLEQYQNYPKETQKTIRNQLNLKGNKIKI